MTDMKHAILDGVVRGNLMNIEMMRLSMTDTDILNHIVERLKVGLMEAENYKKVNG
jgi:hypothetical protein